MSQTPRAPARDGSCWVAVTPAIATRPVVQIFKFGAATELKSLFKGAADELLQLLHLFLRADESLRNRIIEQFRAQGFKLRDLLRLQLNPFALLEPEQMTEVIHLL